MISCAALEHQPKQCAFTLVRQYREGYNSFVVRVTRVHRTNA